MTHCLHLGTCGGCAFSRRDAFDKPALLARALSQAGFPNVALAPLVVTPLHSRRRMDLAASRRGAEIALGLHEARSNTIVNMTECALLSPVLFALVAPLRALLGRLDGFRRQASVSVNLLDGGADILLRLDFPASKPDRDKLIAFARAHHALRISVAPAGAEPEPVAILAPPVLTLSGIAVEPAPGAFLQATLASTAAILAAVLAGLPNLKPKSRIVELYAGIGTISFALRQAARVEAYEGNADAVAAQDAAIRRANLTGSMRVATRDLTRRPLKPVEMSGAAAIVLDPPYAGAGAQMKAIAESAVPRIIYVSCNPAALANDSYPLRNAGYHLLAATPIDQFPYSENLESVVVFQRP